MEIFCDYFNKVLDLKDVTPPPPPPPPTPPPQAAPALEPGQFVTISGLQKRPDLNELEAIVQAILPNGRAQVIWRKKDTLTPRVPPQVELQL